MSAALHPTALLFEHALGALGGDERARVDEHAMECTDCQAELGALAAAASGLALALRPVAPSPDLRARLLASAAVERGGRLSRFAARVAELIGDTVARATELLERLDRPDGGGAWVPGPAPGITLIHFEAGPAYAGSLTGFVKVVAGATFPMHTHTGLETAIVLEGGYRDDDGRDYHQGSVAEKPAGSSHTFSARPGGPDCLFVVRIDGKVEIDGVEI
jgi:putative transcriptional regulator